MTDPVIEVVTEGVLAARCIELGEEISRDMADRQPIFVGILNGAVPFLADLIRHVPGPVEVDFLSLTRFGESGRVQISFDTETPLVGRHVVLVEDIVDTGLTLSALRSFMETRDVASVSTVTLIDKVTQAASSMCPWSTAASRSATSSSSGMDSIGRVSTATSPASGQ